MANKVIITSNWLVSIFRLVSNLEKHIIELGYCVNQLRDVCFLPARCIDEISTSFRMFYAQSPTGRSPIRQLQTFQREKRTYWMFWNPAFSSHSFVSPIAWLRPSGVATRWIRFNSVGHRGETRLSFKYCA